MFGSDTCPLDWAKQIIFIISIEEMYDILKILKSLEEYGLLLKGVRETIQNEAKGDVSLLGDLFTVKGTIKAGEGTIRAGQDFRCLLIL